VIFASAKASQDKYSLLKWGQPPGEWGHTSSVVSNHKDLILVLRRADPPILIFNREGKVVNSFGTGMFERPHSLDVDRDGYVWATDTQENVVYKFSMDGKLLMTLGKKGRSGGNDSPDLFNGPTDVAVAPNGDIFVADGDRNNRIVKFTRDGKFVRIIGGMKSSAPGQFGPAPGMKPSGGLVHAIAFDSKGRLITIESFNPRIQMFAQDGTFIRQWIVPGLMKPCGLAIAPDDTIYIGDTDAGSITVVKNGKVTDRIHQAGIRPHNIGLDPRGDLFIADVDVEKTPSTDAKTPGWIQNTAGIWKMVRN
jgi:DNA-binding beta-propeller fold protein YncE